MTTFRRFADGDLPRVSNIATDDAGYLWISYEKDTDGICHLKKCSATDLNQVYFDIEIEVDSIVDMKIKGNYIYTLYNNDSVVLSRYNLNNPFTDTTDFAKPFGIPNPLELAISDSNVLVLLPDPSGIVSNRVLVYAPSSTYQQVLILSDYDVSVSDVSSITSDDDDNFWLVTYTNPAKLIRLWFASGGWNFQLTSIS